MATEQTTPDGRTAKRRAGLARAVRMVRSRRPAWTRHRAVRWAGLVLSLIVVALAGIHLAGHLHARRVSMMPQLAGRGSTRLMVGGSTGGAGLRGLESETPTPLQMSVLYLDPSHSLQAYDEITVGGSGTAEVTVRRQVPDDGTPQAEQASPDPSAAPDSPPASPSHR